MVSLWRLGGRLMAMTNEVKTGLMVSGAFAAASKTTPLPFPLATTPALKTN